MEDTKMSVIPTMEEDLGDEVNQDNTTLVPSGVKLEQSGQISSVSSELPNDSPPLPKIRDISNRGSFDGTEKEPKTQSLETELVTGSAIPAPELSSTQSCKPGYDITDPKSAPTNPIPNFDHGGRRSFLACLVTTKDKPKPIVTMVTDEQVPSVDRQTVMSEKQEVPNGVQNMSSMEQAPVDVPSEGPNSSLDVTTQSSTCSVTSCLSNSCPSTPSATTENDSVTDIPEMSASISGSAVVENDSVNSSREMSPSTPSTVVEASELRVSPAVLAELDQMAAEQDRETQSSADEMVVVASRDASYGDGATEEQVQGLVDSTEGQVQGLVDSAGGLVKGLVDSAEGQVQGPVDSVGGQVQGPVDSADGQVQEPVDSADEQVQGQVDSADGQVQGLVDSAEEQVQGQVDSADGQVQGLVDSADEQVQGQVVLDPGNECSSTVEPSGGIVRTAASQDPDSILDECSSENGSAMDLPSVTLHESSPKTSDSEDSYMRDNDHLCETSGLAGSLQALDLPEPCEPDPRLSVSLRDVPLYPSDSTVSSALSCDSTFTSEGLSWSSEQIAERVREDQRALEATKLQETTSEVRGHLCGGSGTELTCDDGNTDKSDVGDKTIINNQTCNNCEPATGYASTSTEMEICEVRQPEDENQKESSVGNGSDDGVGDVFKHPKEGHVKSRSMSDTVRPLLSKEAWDKFGTTYEATECLHITIQRPSVAGLEMGNCSFDTSDTDSDSSDDSDAGPEPRLTKSADDIYQMSSLFDNRPMTKDLLKIMFDLSDDFLEVKNKSSTLPTGATNVKQPYFIDSDCLSVSTDSELNSVEKSITGDQHDLKENTAPEINASEVSLSGLDDTDLDGDLDQIELLFPTEGNSCYKNKHVDEDPEECHVPSAVCDDADRIDLDSAVCPTSEIYEVLEDQGQDGVVVMTTSDEDTAGSTTSFGGHSGAGIPPSRAQAPIDRDRVPGKARVQPIGHRDLSSGPIGIPVTSANGTAHNMPMSLPSGNMLEERQENDALRGEVGHLRKELSKCRDTIRKMQEREELLKDRLSAQALKQIEKGSTKFEDLNLGDNRPTQLIRRYGNLYSETRLDAFDALEDLPEIAEFDDLKGKLLFSVVVLAFRAVQRSLVDTRNKVRHLLCIPHPESKSSFAKEPIVRELEDTISVYLRKFVDRYDVTKNVETPLHDLSEEVCGQVWSTLYDYPSLKECAGLKQYIEECVHLAWALSVQNPPLIIEYDSRDFNDNLHSRFHTSDPESARIKSILWPCLREGDKGPCVFKGVVVT